MLLFKSVFLTLVFLKTFASAANLSVLVPHIKRFSSLNSSITEDDIFTRVDSENENDLSEKVSNSGNLNTTDNVNVDNEAAYIESHKNLQLENVKSGSGITTTNSSVTDDNVKTEPRSNLLIIVIAVVALLAIGSTVGGFLIFKKNQLDEAVEL